MGDVVYNTPLLSVKRLGNPLKKRQGTQEEKSSRKKIKMDEDSQFDRIPDEMLLHILSFLPSYDLLDSVSSLGSRFTRLVNTRSLWINADINLSQGRNSPFFLKCYHRFTSFF
jgi:hypothetical protein